MSTSVNMSLDDVIKMNKKSGKKTGGPKGQAKPAGNKGAAGKKGPGGKASPGKAQRLVVTNKGAKKARVSVKAGTGKGAATRVTYVQPTQAKETKTVTSRTRLRVANLDSKITNQELFELFSVLGSLSRCQIDYDNLGRSKHTANIEYENPEGARKAVSEYNGNVLDGKRLEVKYAKTTKEVPGVRRKAEIRKEKVVITTAPARGRGGRGGPKQVRGTKRTRGGSRGGKRGGK